MNRYYVTPTIVVSAEHPQQAVDAIAKLASTERVLLPGAVVSVHGLDVAGEPINSVAVDIGDDTLPVHDWTLPDPAAPPAKQAPPAKRFFRVDSPGPSWTMVAANARDAWRQWLAWHDACGDGEMEGDYELKEMTADQVAAARVDDDGQRRSLADMELGATFCSEF